MDSMVQPIATFIGEHALLLLAGGLLLMLVITATLWWLVQRYGEALWTFTAQLWSQLQRSAWFQRGVQALPTGATRLWQPLRPGGYLGLHMLLGFPLVLLAASIFVEIVDEIQEGEDLGLFDQTLTAALQQTSTPEVLQGFFIITHLGDVATLTALGIAIALLLVLRGQLLLACGWSLALAGNGLLNKALKALFQRVRPLHEHGLVLEHGWSFPSGHSSGALVAYGMLAYLLVRALPKVWHLPVVIGAMLIILLVGSSRIFLQVHYFSDVVAGYVSGAAWLAVCIAGTEIALRHRRRDAEISRAQ